MRPGDPPVALAILVSYSIARPPPPVASNLDCCLSTRSQIWRGQCVWRDTVVTLSVYFFIEPLSQTLTECSGYWVQDWRSTYLHRGSDSMGNDLDISEEKRRELARGYAAELVQAVDWLIAESETPIPSKVGSSVHNQRGRRQKVARRLRTE